MTDLLVSRIQECGSQKEFAKQKGLSASYISDVLMGRRPFADRLLFALGYQREVRYQKIQEEA